MKALKRGAIRPFIPTGLPANLPPIEYQDTCTGKLALSGGVVVGWIYPGNYSTQRHDKRFFDVAYVSPCYTKAGDHTGSMLDSECFDSEAEALAFIESLVQGGAA